MQSFKRNPGKQKRPKVRENYRKKEVIMLLFHGVGEGGGVVSCNSRADHVSGTQVSKTSIWYHVACKEWVTCCMSSVPWQGSEGNTPINSFTESKHWNI